MASNLEVEVEGLRSSSYASETVAAGLAGAATEQVGNSRPSGLGIAAMEAASAAVRTRQSARIAQQAVKLSAAGTRYDATDSGNAGALDGAI